MKPRMLGLAVYHSVDFSEQPERLDPLLAAVSLAASGSRRLSYVQGMFTSSDRFSRQHAVTAKALAQLRTDLRGRIFQTLEFTSLRKSEQLKSQGYASLVITVKAARNPRVSADRQVLYPYRLSLLLPEDEGNVATMVADTLVAIADLLEEPYGFVYIGKDYRDALMEVTSIPLFPWGTQLTESELTRQERLDQCQGQRADIGDVVCGAYWPNVLSSSVVTRLGGATQVRAAAPAALVRELTQGRIYLQLTPELTEPRDPRLPGGARCARELLATGHGEGSEFRIALASAAEPDS